MGAAVFSQDYTYNAVDGSINTVTMPDKYLLTMGYDSLRRLSTVTSQYTDPVTGAVTDGITDKRYLYRTFEDNTTTDQVTSLSYTGLSKVFQYSYDIRGNIATYAAPGKSTVTYTYDKQGQLLSASNGYSYTYDNVGNILTATKNGTTHTYTYSTYDWKDKLISYDGQAIAYDASGNPTSYYNGTRWTFGWENGRELSTATSGNTNLSFAYDGEGVRTSKTVNGVEHKYYYSGGKLLRETYGSNILDFAYNPDGTLYSLRVNGTYYYYVTNLQGDVIAIVDKDKNVVASYEYDPYGDVISATGTLAEINPLRYRGYYYDAESDLYYLQSRYYDPELGRFINADVFTSTGQGLLGNNMFAYCANNPIARQDTDGEAFETVFDLVSLGFSIAEVAANPYDPMAWVGLAGDTIDLIPFVTGVGETVRGLRFVDKVGNTLEITKAVDFTDDVGKAMKNLDKSNGFTKSARETGIQIHTCYKTGPDFVSDYKEYNRVKGIRPDYYDKDSGIIYELKPYNRRAARAGVRQLQRYNQMLGGNNVMRLEFY